MRFDFHIHSHYSYDSFNTIPNIITTALNKKLSGIAIADHGTFSGYREAYQYMSSRSIDLLLIPAMEIQTPHGEIVALFIHKEITVRSFSDVIDEIKAQQGLSMLAHPFKRARTIPETVVRAVDAIEVFNARGQSLVSYDCNKKAHALARENQKPGLAGSDAHFLWEIGRGVAEFGNIKNLDQLKKEITQGHTQRIHGAKTSLYAEVLSQGVKYIKRRQSVSLFSIIKRFLRTIRWYIKTIISGELP
ncbi:MAG: PHP domain-containing protein [Elusimicrobia bacterium]|nr:PHP domain-containing protein [Elusimicrobiota bacterium]MBD3412642.1 PHP domain-containing protein [Elusimicrobiota bacterium]